MNSDPTIWERAYVVAVGATTWLAGEAGRAMVAGAAGGLFRWLMQERRRLRDGLVAVGAGVIAANYLAPVVLAILSLAGLDLAKVDGIDATGGFLAGLAGMSLAKLSLAIMEAQANRLRGGK